MEVLEELSGVSRLDQTLANVICTCQLSKRLGSSLHLPTFTDSHFERFSAIADMADDPPGKDSPAPAISRRKRIPITNSNSRLAPPTTRVVLNTTVSCELTMNAILAAAEGICKWVPSLHRSVCSQNSGLVCDDSTLTNVRIKILLTH